MRRVAFSLVVVVLVGCAKPGLSRDTLQSRYVDGLIEAGVDETTAECVIGRFFDELDDSALKRFNTSGTSLTPAQEARIGELTTSCRSS